MEIGAKRLVILDWIVQKSINGEYLGMKEVPEYNEELGQQTEEWWLDAFGGMPPAPIDGGNYLYYYRSQIPDEILDELYGCLSADAEIELGDDLIYLYKIG